MPITRTGTGPSRRRTSLADQVERRENLGRVAQRSPAPRAAGAEHARAVIASNSTRRRPRSREPADPRPARPHREGASVLPRSSRRGRKQTHEIRAATREIELSGPAPSVLSPSQCRASPAARDRVAPEESYRSSRRQSLPTCRLLRTASGSTSRRRGRDSAFEWRTRHVAC